MDTVKLMNANVKALALYIHELCKGKNRKKANNLPNKLVTVFNNLHRMQAGNN